MLQLQFLKVIKKIRQKQKSDNNQTERYPKMRHVYVKTV